MSFGEQSTTDEVLEGIDLSGTQALVTGASAGLGQETARALAAHGASVILGGPRPREGRAGGRADPRAAAAGRATIELREVDLASLGVGAAASATACSPTTTGSTCSIANAGLMAPPFGTTADGFESQFGTNHLGHFVLVNRLVPLLVAGAPSRIVNLSSGGHRFGDVDLDDPNFEHQDYDPWVGYGRAKTANMLFAVELDRRLRDRGVRATAVHPGMIVTELGPAPDRGVHRGGGRRPRRPEGRAQGGRRRRGHVGVGRRGRRRRRGGRALLRGLRGLAGRSPTGSASPGVMAYALDPDTAAALWARSEELVGEQFDHLKVECSHMHCCR